MRSADAAFETLRPGQVVNHFEMSTSMTTKVGLLQCLRELHWTAGADARAVLPRCYDLTDEGELEAFAAVRTLRSARDNARALP